jgi:hypothetical protein
MTGAGLGEGDAIAGAVGVNSGLADEDLSAGRSQAAMPTAMAIATSTTGVGAPFTIAPTWRRT